ncbi:MAG TPA: HAMP domain-containing sensor histidine kinase [Ruminiclostridium sp.]
MGLKKRLIISNAAIVVIPVLITVVASFIFLFVSSRILDRDLSYEQISKTIDIRTELFKTEGSSMQSNPEQLFNKDFQDYYAAKFATVSTEIIVIKKNEPVFFTKILDPIDLQKCLAEKDSSVSKDTIELNGLTYIVKVLPLIFKDDIPGDIILLSNLGKNGSTANIFIIFVPIVFLISFFITNIVSSLYFSKSLIKPLNRLKTAAGEISSGNLSHEVVVDGDSELRDLSNSFEQMRLKLKESVNTHLKYDDNRKMLVSSISHDLKTPITSIKGYVEGIIDGVANTPEKREKYLKTIYLKATNMDVMIDDLLLFSKLDLNQIPFNFEKTDIVKYFEDCIQENEPDLEKVSIKLAFVSELKQFKFVSIDRERLKRVINNILDNARKYMNKQKGEITILLRENKVDIIVEIQDNGSGIAKEDLLYVFDRFYRADTARSNISGSGLGLAIAKQIIEGHGGKIWIRSDKATGTSIMISLKKVS